MQFLVIILLCVLSSIVYGILHDQVTARICVEYFTVGHPPVFDTDDPTLLGIGWGIIATWWVCLILGFFLALASRIGCWPKRSVRSLVRPIAILLLATSACALMAGFVGYSLAQDERVWLLEPMVSRIPKDRHAPFIADLWAHLASYAAGAIGGLVLIVFVLIKRWKSSGPQIASTQSAGNGGAVVGGVK